MASGRTAEQHRIPCPYCLVGGVVIVVERPGGAVQVENFDEPRQCGTCKQYFQLKYRVQIYGAHMEVPNGNGKVVAIGRK